MARQVQGGNVEKNSISIFERLIFSELRFSSDLLWKYPEIRFFFINKVGDTLSVNGGGWVSCCATGVELDVEDVATNRIVAFESRDNEMPWSTLIPIAVIASLVIVIIIIVFSVCYCRRKYGAVSQTVV